MSPGWIATVKCPTVIWYPDDVLELPVAQNDVKAYGHVYDYFYYFDQAGFPALKRLGVSNPRLLLPATDPEVYKRQNIVKKVHDVSFVGNIFPERRKILDRLKKQFRVLETQAFMGKMVDIFSKSKIVFNLGVGKTGYQLRVFEALGMACFCLTNEIPPEFRVFEDRKHLAYYNNGNLEGLITHYLARDADREAIAQRGYAEVMSKHTYNHRVSQILKDVA